MRLPAQRQLLLPWAFWPPIPRRRQFGHDRHDLRLDALHLHRAAAAGAAAAARAAAALARAAAALAAQLSELPRGHRADIAAP